MNILNLFIATVQTIPAQTASLSGMSVLAFIQWPSSFIPVFLSIGMIALGGLLYYYRMYTQHKKNNLLLEQNIGQLKIKTNRLQTEYNQLKIAEEKLKNTNFTKDKFFSIIAHDLKGPLNSLTGLLQLLIKYADSFSKDELKDFGRNMNKSVNNLLDLLENLLHWSQSQSGMMEYSPEEINLHEVITKTVSLLTPAAENKDIRLTSQINNDLAVFADRNMISFTLRNILSNAIKFTNKGGSVSIVATLRDGQAEISIQDTGIGMSADDLEKLFRIDKCYTTNGTSNEIGTGLGLILCNEFIVKNKGRITVESEVNKGSVFRFVLPVVTTNERIPVEDVY
ncbi:HAMP domain-containing sensor histidine kinase [Rhodocytophaga aerolata]|uniref:histidine kinase n=1 Tax=Rhodocytophaga aerolata TaxID=455078 RepID=A0ABT8R9C8_9BACT|nr:HAMP domain-containing sensor histidine kinase [Rhodocytophaga aerolata]MDO1448697.1 HAMP domain-containing sensor histidine kinase [Rhodocytophaga aerolata]